MYSYDDKLLNEETALIDMGTYNYSPHGGEGGVLGHFDKDVVPYSFRKNTKKDYWELENI